MYQHFIKNQFVINEFSSRTFFLLFTVNADEARKWEDGRKPKKVKGGIIVGVTIATTFVAILIFCAVFLIYRARRKR